MLINLGTRREETVPTSPLSICYRGGAHLTDGETEARRHMARGHTLIPQSFEDLP